jgi:FPC/CPF motif-containing protein YcgG
VDAQRRLASANPFAAGGSNYCRRDGTRLVRVLDGVPATRMTAFVHDNVRALTLNPQFTCIGAKSAMRQGSYRFGLYPELGADDSVAALAHDLYCFVGEVPSIEGDFTTLIASFGSPAIADEYMFEQLLWSTLQKLHDLDAAHHGWANDVSADPANHRFSFSFAETAFFIVGLHAASSRATRRLAWPTLVFNLHGQFEALKRTGHYDRFRFVIREAERRLQGHTNPMLADFGERSEAAQYSGREVEAAWRCPFASREARDKQR